MIDMIDDAMYTGDGDGVSKQIIRCCCTTRELVRSSRPAVERDTEAEMSLGVEYNGTDIRNILRRCRVTDSVHPRSLSPGTYNAN
jgi:hypothetical protein